MTENAEKQAGQERVGQQSQQRNDESNSRARGEQQDGKPEPTAKEKPRRRRGVEERQGFFGRCRGWARQHGRLLVITGSVLAGSAIGVALLAWALAERNAALSAQDKLQSSEEKLARFQAAVKYERGQAQEARHDVVRERERVQRELNEARRGDQNTQDILVFLRDKLLAAGRPAGWAKGRWSKGAGEGPSLRKAVDVAEAQIGAKFADRPLVEAGLRETLGSAYLNLGEPAAAVKQYQRALGLRQAKLGRDHPDTIQCRNDLARAYRLAGRVTEAGQLYDNRRK